MVYVIAAYHDIGHYIDAKNHEKVSAEILLADDRLREFFTQDQIEIMAQAVYDHRASMEGEPRSIYGKIVSSADRNTLVEVPLKRTYAYRIDHNPEDTLEQIIEESRKHIIDKFGKKGYATEKMYFEDLEYIKFLEDISNLADNKEEFAKRFMQVNGLNDNFKWICNELKSYTKNVRQDLKKYIAKYIFPEYKKNDGGHNIAHILEVIRRSFVLNATFKLGLDDNMMYVIAACHDWGKYEGNEVHHINAARKFMNDLGMKKFFIDEERQMIKEAIEDHRSSKEDEPRSIYGKLISSADRNTTIEIVFIRSFFVAHERMPEMSVEEYLDYTIKRLSKKYDEENPENMFFEDETYRVFIQEMRELLKHEEEFKDRYCQVNNITSRKNKVKDEKGKIEYIKNLRITNEF